jgi:hypothetical protein
VKDETYNPEPIHRAGRGVITICENWQGLEELSLYGELPRSVINEILRVCSPNLWKIEIPALLNAGAYRILASRCALLS